MPAKKATLFPKHGEKPARGASASLDIFKRACLIIDAADTLPAGLIHRSGLAPRTALTYNTNQRHPNGACFQPRSFHGLCQQCVQFYTLSHP